jgi:hypothetical protein
MPRLAARSWLSARRVSYEPADRSLWSRLGNVQRPTLSRDQRERFAGTRTAQPAWHIKILLGITDRSRNDSGRGYSPAEPVGRPRYRSSPQPQRTADNDRRVRTTSAPDRIASGNIFRPASPGEIVAPLTIFESFDIPVRSPHSPPLPHASGRPTQPGPPGATPVRIEFSRTEGS